MILERGYLLNNRYRIIEILGQGGMGSVYRAIDENLGVDVAVKDNLFTNEEYASQFRREAVILASLRQANLPRVTDHFVLKGQGQYLVMDYIEGEDLRERMERMGNLPEEDVITIGIAVCEALNYLESRNPPVVHRDIKPGNIKITPTGHIYLVDFGLVKTLKDSQITATGARAMTPGYSPPEQYGTARTDGRSDIYSLGATLYAALAGIIPEDSMARVMGQDKLTPVRKHNPRISRRLEVVLEKSLALRPENRYQTANEFQKALISLSTSTGKKDELKIAPPPSMDGIVINGDGPQPKSEEGKLPSPLPTSQVLTDAQSDKPKKSLPMRIYGLGCLAILILFSIVGLVIGRQVLNTNTWVGQFPALLFQLSQTTPGTPVYWFIPGIGDVQFAKNTATIVEITSTSLTKTLSPTRQGTLTPTPTVVTPTPQPTQTEVPTPTTTPTPAPTPIGGGGGQVAFASLRNGKPQIFVVNLDNTGLYQVTDMMDGACQPFWSPDGKQLVFISPCEGNDESYPGSGMFIINADGSDVTPLPTVPGGDFDPVWSPDGKKIAFTSVRNSGQPEIYVLNLDDLSVEVLSIRFGRDRQPFWSPDGNEIIFVSEREGNPQLWVMNADGSNQVKFSTSVGRHNLHPNWSPDMKLVLFTQLLAKVGIPQLVIAPFDGSTYQEYRMIKDQSPRRDARFSTDGYWVVYEGWPTGNNHDIFITTINGGERQSLASDPAQDFDPAWKPVP
jgi:serine/threonine protein kinase/Tol biopolymer transport system component